MAFEIGNNKGQYPTFGHFVAANKEEIAKSLGLDSNTSLWGENGLVNQFSKLNYGQGVYGKDGANFYKNMNSGDTITTQNLLDNKKSKNELGLDSKDYKFNLEDFDFAKKDLCPPKADKTADEYAKENMKKAAELKGPALPSASPAKADKTAEEYAQENMKKAAELKGPALPSASPAKADKTAEEYARENMKKAAELKEPISVPVITAPAMESAPEPHVDPAKNPTSAQQKSYDTALTVAEAKVNDIKSALGARTLSAMQKNAITGKYNAALQEFNSLKDLGPTGFYNKRAETAQAKVEQTEKDMNGAWFGFTKKHYSQMNTVALKELDKIQAEAN